MNKLLNIIYKFMNVESDMYFKNFPIYVMYVLQTKLTLDHDASYTYVKLSEKFIEIIRPTLISR